MNTATGNGTKALGWNRFGRSCFVKHVSPSLSPIASSRFNCDIRSLSHSAPSGDRCSSANRKVQFQQADFSSSATNYDRLGRRAKEKLLDREFFLSLLNSASTKREARQYLARFKNNNNNTANSEGNNKAGVVAKEKDTVVHLAPEPSLPGAANLGSFYGASRSVYNSPVFRLDTTPSPPVEGSNERLHLALLKVTTPQLLDDYIVDGVAKTLSQLTRLGLGCCVVVDAGAMDDYRVLRKISLEQADRISTAVDAQPDSKSLRLDSVLSIAPTHPAFPKVLSRKALLRPLRDGQIVIMTSIAYTEYSPKAVLVPANDAVLALTKELAGLATTPDPDEDPVISAQRINALQREVSLDRVILLDPLGGIPAFSGPQPSHVFINMEQEFNNIQDELVRMTQSATSEAGSGHRAISSSPSQSALEGHLENLRLSQKTLSLLPATSSGIITSPAEVAVSAKAPQESPELSAVGTRRLRNPLIHNLLTDKSVHSSSLPLSRRAAMSGSRDNSNHSNNNNKKKYGNDNNTSQANAPTTFVKRGMPLTMFPDPRHTPWTAQSRPKLKLDDPSIDLPRLVYLIEDSFNRKLDVKEYLNRINDRLAGLIIAGEYEGGAILTWETPPGVVDDGSEESTSRLVPYLDKFAVLKRSQGAGGVADIVFNAMVRACFPNGVCWRSRKDNPVNKWYFERSQGTWKLSDSTWTMFWTTPDLPEDLQMLRDYEGVCRGIQPSWADKGMLE